ncbi:MAG: hypothetical protein U0176_19010 [Bacteroidia bacterium]
MKKSVTQIKLFISIAIAMAAPFSLMLPMSEAMRESTEVNFGLIFVGILLALIVGERHLHRHAKANN